MKNKTKQAMKNVLFLMITSAVLFISCKKDKVEETPAVPIAPTKTVSQKITAKWGVTTIAENDYYSNTSHTTSYNGVASDYLDFRSDGKLYAQIIPFGKDTIPYNLVNDSTLNLDSEIYKIKQLTDIKFVLYAKDISSTIHLEYYESTITLAK